MYGIQIDGLWVLAANGLLCADTEDDAQWQLEAVTEYYSLTPARTVTVYVAGLPEAFDAGRPGPQQVWIDCNLNDYLRSCGEDLAS